MKPGTEGSILGFMASLSNRLWLRLRRAAPLRFSRPRSSASFRLIGTHECFIGGWKSQFVSSCRRQRLVIGGRDTEAGAASVRLHHAGLQGAGIKIVIAILEQESRR